MEYIAKIVTVSKFKNITDNLKPFVNFHSELGKIDVQEDDQIVLLQIEGTESYFPIFLNMKPTIDQIEEKLARQQTRLNTDTRKMLIKYLEENM
jgi:hypothetical protein